MSQNEVDEIAQRTGHTIREVFTAVGQYLRTHGLTGKRLDRKRKLELAEHVLAEVGEQRITEAWYQKRVQDYQAEAAHVAYRRDNDAFYTKGDAELDRERLSAMRYRIEQSLPHTGMATEHRGQVVLALDAADRNPNAATRNVFERMDQDTARDARIAAVESEQWVTARQQENMREIAAQQSVRGKRNSAVWQQATGGATPQPNPSTQAATSSTVAREIEADSKFRQADAVQRIRHAQNVWARDQVERKHGNQPQQMRQAAADNAKAAGLSIEQIRWEFDNAEANSRCRVQINATSPDGGAETHHGYFPSEAEAAQEVNKVLTESNWKAGTQFTVRAREAGQRKPFYIAEGNQTSVGKATGQWQHDSGGGRDTESSRSQQHSQATAEPPDLETHYRLAREHNDKLTEQNATLTADLTKVTAEKDGLAERVKALVGELAKVRGDTGSHPKKAKANAFGHTGANAFATVNNGQGQGMSR